MTTTTQVIFFEIGDTLIRKNRWVPGAKEMLDQLKSSGQRLGLLCNTGPIKKADLPKVLPEDFDFSVFEDELVILSSEVSMEKPDIKIFELALERAATSKPRECLFVGENARETLVAQSAGMCSLRLDPVHDDLTRLPDMLP